MSDAKTKAADNDPFERHKEIVETVNKSEFGKHLLHYLDVIDTKVSAIFRFLGLQFAAIIFFITLENITADINLKWFVFGALLFMSAGLLFSFPCLFIIKIEEFMKGKNNETEYLKKLNSLSLTRRRLYLASYFSSFFGFVITLAMIFYYIFT